MTYKGAIKIESNLDCKNWIHPFSKILPWSHQDLA